MKSFGRAEEELLSVVIIVCAFVTVSDVCQGAHSFDPLLEKEKSAMTPWKHIGKKQNNKKKKKLFKV